MTYSRNQRRYIVSPNQGVRYTDFSSRKWSLKFSRILLFIFWLIGRFRFSWGYKKEQSSEDGFDKIQKSLEANSLCELGNAINSFRFFHFEETTKQILLWSNWKSVNMWDILNILKRHISCQFKLSSSRYYQIYKIQEFHCKSYFVKLCWISSII